MHMYMYIYVYMYYVYVYMYYVLCICIYVLCICIYVLCIMYMYYHSISSYSPPTVRGGRDAESAATEAMHRNSMPQINTSRYLAINGNILAVPEYKANVSLSRQSEIFNRG